MVKMVLFVCTHNAGRSVMAEAFFNAYIRNPDWHAQSAGTAPNAKVNPAVVQAMAEKGIDISSHIPRLLTLADAQAAEKIFTMGCTDGCPLAPPEKTEDWKLGDPAGKPIEAVRPIRDDVERRVKQLVANLD